MTGTGFPGILAPVATNNFYDCYIFFDSLHIPEEQEKILCSTYKSNQSQTYKDYDLIF
jgi:hypothetical protein